MQTSNGYPLDLNDRGQGVDHRPPTSPEAYQERMARVEASGVYEAHAAKCQAARERAAARRFRLGVRSEAGFPCPEPSGPSENDSAYRAGMDAGFRLGQEWDGINGGWGAAYAAGCEVGRGWRIRWGIYSAVTGHYLGSFTHRGDAARGAGVLKCHFRPLPW